MYSADIYDSDWENEADKQCLVQMRKSYGKLFAVDDVFTLPLKMPQM